MKVLMRLFFVGECSPGMLETLVKEQEIPCLPPIGTQLTPGPDEAYSEDLLIDSDEWSVKSIIWDESHPQRFEIETGIVSVGNKQRLIEIMQSHGWKHAP